MFPSSADPAQVDEVVRRTAEAFRERPTCRGVTASVDALMGPSAKGGMFGRVLEADFDELGDLLGVLDEESFREIRSATEALEPTLLVFECQEV